MVKCKGFNLTLKAAFFLQNGVWLAFVEGPTVVILVKNTVRTGSYTDF